MTLLINAHGQCYIQILFISILIFHQLPTNNFDLAVYTFIVNKACTDSIFVYK